MSKVNKVIEILTQRINDNTYVENVRIPSEYILADELKVNRITINKAINAMIQSGLLERGSSSRDGTYIKNNQNRSNGKIAILFRRDVSYDTQILLGSLDCATRNNYLLTVASPHPNEIYATIKKLYSSGISGIVIANYGNIEVDSDKPLVYGDCLNNSENNLSIDMFSAGYKLAEEIIAAGHKEIVFTHYLSIPIESDPRISGFITKLREVGFENPEEYFHSINENAPDFALHEIMNNHPNATCMVGYSDHFIYKLAFLYKNKISNDFFKQLTFAGFGNLKEIQNVFPILTVEQHPYELGKYATTMLIDILNPKQKKSPIPKKITPFIVNKNLIKR